MAHKESRLQYECVRWFRNESGIKFQDNLWSVSNEGRDVNTKMSLGMRPGASDLMWKDHRGLIPIEMKYPGETHTYEHLVRQAEWIINVGDGGGFCDNLDQFKAIISGQPAWYDPRVVLEYLHRLRNKYVVWDGHKFLKQ